MCKVIGLLLMFSWAGAVSAATVVQVWSAEVSQVTNNSGDSPFTSTAYNGYYVGDTVTWTVTYDSDAGDHYTVYRDGPDGIADRGGNDDTVELFACLDQNSYANCEPADLSNTMFAVYNTHTDASDIYDTMAGFLAPDTSVYDNHTGNTDNLRHKREPGAGYLDHTYFTDEFQMTNDYGFANGGSAHLTYEKPNGEVWVSSIHYANISVSTTVVPIPAAAWLFGSALLGLGVVKRKKDSDRH